MKRIIPYIISILLLGSGCNNDPCLKGSGDTISEIRDITNEIEIITLFDNLNLDIYIDTLNYIEIEGGENTIAFIETKINGNELVISNKNKCSFLRNFDQDISINIHIASFNTIEYGGSRNIIMHDTLNVENFRFTSTEGAGSIKLLLNCSGTAIIQSINGFADITLYGKSPHTGYYNDGSGWIFGKSFQNKSASVENRSAGDCIVNADSSLHCILNGIGNIQYIGNPVITVKENNGKGTIFQTK